MSGLAWRWSLILMFATVVFASNLTLHFHGPRALPVTSFALVGFVFGGRAYLHRHWPGLDPWPRLLAVVAFAAIVTLGVAPEAGRVAGASYLSYLFSGWAAAVAYDLGRELPRRRRQVVGALTGAYVDSMIFPTLAFGGLHFWTVVHLTAIKMAGAWTWVLLLHGPLMLENVVFGALFRRRDLIPAPEGQTMRTPEETETPPRGNPRVNTERVRDAVRSLLDALGVDPRDPDAQGVPLRVAEFWREFVDGPRPELDAPVPAESGLRVVVGECVVWSVSRVSLMPFRATLSVGYRTVGSMLFPSGLARVAEVCARGLQTQEGLTSDVAETVKALTGSPDVVVACRTLQTMDALRGLGTTGGITFSAHGLYKDPAVMAAWLSACRGMQ